MGMYATWVAVRTDDRASVLDGLGLVETGEVDFEGSGPLSCAVLPGWVVVVAHRGRDLATPAAMGRLSAGREAVGGELSEHVMRSVAHGYRDGARVWSVIRDAEREPDDLLAEGAPPPEFAPLRARLLREQAEEEGADYLFEGPPALSAAICGFRPDDGVLPVETVFRALETARGGKAGERQAEQRAFRERLTARVEGELFPIAEQLGFEPLRRHPAFHPFHPRGGATAFVRLRGEWSESLEFLWDIREGAPRVAVNFMVRKGREPRYGHPGQAYVPPKPLTLMERFRGRKQAPEDALTLAIEDGKMLLAALDRHLRDGSSHPNVQPAAYEA